MVQTQELTKYLDGLLNVSAFRDYAPNGLQVEGRASIGKLVCGVTASRALIDAAIEAQADAILVHHGYFWKGEDPRLIGMKGERIRRLMQAGMNLLAYHLPLDAHAELGNNAQLASRLDFVVSGRFIDDPDNGIGMYGRLPSPMAGDKLAQHITKVLDRQPLYVPAGDQAINTIAWCSGGAQGYIEQAVELGVDAYLTGEVSEQTVHVARECGIHFFAAGHHATERYGVQALGAHLAKKFKLEYQYIDIENPA